MKFLETTFDEYVNNVNKSNIHKELKSTWREIHKSMPNIILYGPNGTGKYSQLLYYLSLLSPSNLKFERKINIQALNKYNFFLKTSDVHVEIDMELLGCHSKAIWNEMYKLIVDIVQMKKKPIFYIVCKNFSKIHLDLLEIFSFYMNYLHYERVKIRYILHTESLSFLSQGILDKCVTVNVKRPTEAVYANNLNIEKKMIEGKSYDNIKDIKCVNGSLELWKRVTRDLCGVIRSKEIDFKELREKIYNIMVLNHNVHEIIYRVLSKLNIKEVDEEVYVYLKHYNNNYRPIYHLELIFLTIQECYERENSA